MTDAPSGWRSSVGVEHGFGGAATHERAVVATSGVVAVQPHLELAVQIDETVEAATVKRWPVELLQGRALEAFAHGVVVRRARRDAVMDDPQSSDVAGECLADELGAGCR